MLTHQFTRTANNEDKIPSYGSYYTNQQELGLRENRELGVEYQGVEDFG